MHEYVTNTGCIFIGIICIVVAYYQWSFQYWKRRNVPFLDPSMPFGNVKNPLFTTEPPYIELAGYYKKMKKLGHKHAGMYMATEPIYVIIHPENIKRVLVKDFDHFVNHGIYHNAKDDPLSAHIFSAEDNTWKFLRTRLTPTFTSGKMKMMIEAVLECARTYEAEISGHCNAKKPIDIKNAARQYITNVIGSSCFGIECNSFEHPDSEFVTYGKKAFADYDVSPRLILLQWFKNVARKLSFKLISEDVAQFFTNLVSTTVRYRDEYHVRRRDFLQILMDLRGTENELTLNEMTAQVYMFFFAAFESTSSTITFLMHELALHQAIQDRMRDEMEEVIKRHGGEVTYDGLKQMTYMQQILEGRTCTHDYKVPGTDANIAKDTMVLIPSYAIHHDPEYYPDPEKFDPDRFSEENKKHIIPYTYLPFGSGPRECLARRFATMVLKASLVSTLRKHRIQLNSATPEKLSLKTAELSFSNKETVYLDVEKVMK